MSEQLPQDQPSPAFRPQINTSFWGKALLIYILAGLLCFVLLPVVVITLYVKVLVLLLNNNVVGEILLFPLVAGSLIIGYIFFESLFLRKRKKI